MLSKLSLMSSLSTKIVRDLSAKSNDDDVEHADEAQAYESYDCMMNPMKLTKQFTMKANSYI